LQDYVATKSLRYDVFISQLNVRGVAIDALANGLETRWRPNPLMMNLRFNEMFSAKVLEVPARWSWEDH